MNRAHKTPCDDPSCPQFVCENRNAHLPPLKQSDMTTLTHPDPREELKCRFCGGFIPACPKCLPPPTPVEEDVKDALALSKLGRLLPLDKDGNMSADGVRVVIHNLCALASAYRNIKHTLEGREMWIRQTEVLVEQLKSSSESAESQLSQVREALERAYRIGANMLQGPMTRDEIDAAGHKLMDLKRFI